MWVAPFILAPVSGVCDFPRILLLIELGVIESKSAEAAVGRSTAPRAGLTHIISLRGVHSARLHPSHTDNGGREPASQISLAYSRKKKVPKPEKKFQTKLTDYCKQEWMSSTWTDVTPLGAGAAIAAPRPIHGAVLFKPARLFWPECLGAGAAARSSPGRLLVA